jgi:hypothetical protein
MHNRTARNSENCLEGYGMKYNLLEKFARNTKKGAKPKRGRTGKINGALEYDSDFSKHI